MQAIIGKKLKQSQVFFTDGSRRPATIVATEPNIVYAVKTQDHDGYTALQIGFGSKKNATKAEIGHAEGAKQKKAPSFLREIRVETSDGFEKGQAIKSAEMLEAGDIVDVKGFSKGKGFAGAVKRYHFRGGPRTHGQSDRERAVGSIGAGTTPGRVYKNKRMPGKMGNENVTIKNLVVLAVTEGNIVVSGLVPGKIGSNVIVVGTGKKVKKMPEIIDPLIQMPKEEQNVEEPVIDAPAEEVVETPAVEETVTPAAEVSEEVKQEVGEASTEDKAAEEVTEENQETEAIVEEEIEKAEGEESK